MENNVNENVSTVNCTHIEVRHAPETNEDGITTDHWRCADCGLDFVYGVWRENAQRALEGMREATSLCEYWESTAEVYSGIAHRALDSLEDTNMQMLTIVIVGMILACFSFALGYSL